jgi:hypothetical protein
MRRLIVVVTAFAVPLMTGACVKPPLAITAAYPVNVTITCAGAGLKAEIDPYIAQVPEGDEVVWSLTPASTADDFEIDKKDGLFKKWPYDDSPPYKGDKNKPAKAGKMKADQVGKSFAYSITATCTTPTGEKRKVIIDPDMIIIRRNAS